MTNEEQKVALGNKKLARKEGEQGSRNEYTRARKGGNVQEKMNAYLYAEKAKQISE